jgi:hypothetical protein
MNFPLLIKKKKKRVGEGPHTFEKIKSKGLHMLKVETENGN